MSGSTQIALISGQELDKLSREKRIDLKTGDRLEGKVLDVKDGKAHLDFGRFQARLELPLPVRKGDVLTVEVTETTPRTELRLERLQSGGDVIRFSEGGVRRSLGEAPTMVQGRLNMDAGLMMRRETPVEAASLEQRGLYSKVKTPDIRETLNQLRQIMEEGPTASSQDIQELSQKLRELLESLKQYSDALDLRKKIIDPVRRLETGLRESGLSAEPQLREILNRLANAAERLAKIESIDQLPLARSIIRDDLHPALQELEKWLRDKGGNHSLTGTISRPDLPAEAHRELNALLEAVDNTLRLLPEKIFSPGNLSDSDLSVLRGQLDRLARLFENSPVRPDPATSAAINGIMAASGEISRLEMPSDFPQWQTLLRETIRPGLLQVKAFLENRSAPAIPEIHTAAAETKEAVNRLLDSISETLRLLPEPLKTDPAIKKLAEEIQSIRAALEKQSEQVDSGRSIAQGIVRLAQRVEQSGIRLDNELPRILEALSDIVAKIDRIRQPSQLPQLKNILEKELQPLLNDLKTALGPELSGPSPSAPPPELNETVRLIEKEIQMALDRLPDRGKSANDLKRLTAEIDQVLEKLALFPKHAESPFAEEIDALFENIKLALTQLRFNVQAGRPLIDLAAQVKDIFAGLRLNFETGALKETLSNHIQQMEALTQSLQNSPLSQDKDVLQLLGSLKEMMLMMEQLRESGQSRQALDFFQQQVLPRMDAMKQVLASSRFNQNPEIRQMVAPFIRAVETIITQVGEYVQSQSGSDALEQFMQKIDDLPPEVRDVLSKMPSSLRTPENMAKLTQAVREILSRSDNISTEQGLPPNASSSSALPPEIREMLSRLGSHFEPLDIGESAIKLAPRLKSLIENSGMFFEKKMEEAIQRFMEATERLGGMDNLGRLPDIRSIISEDLKPNLLKLQEFFNRNNPAQDSPRQDSLETLRKAVDELLNSINGQQARAQEQFVQQQSQQQNQLVFFSFQLPVKGQEDAQLKVFYNKKKGNAPDEDFRLSLLLDMERLGQIRTDFANSGKNLTITFYVKAADIKGHIDSHLHQIRESLGEEFNSLAISVLVSREKIAEFRSETSAPDIISESAVDVKV